MGSSQTIISENLAKTNRMFVNPRKKKQIWNASNERMLCRGTATFEVSYGGQTTDISALVSPDLDDDVLLGEKAFQRRSLEGGKLKPMNGGPMTIHMKKGDIRPTHIYTACKCSSKNMPKMNLTNQRTWELFRK